MRYFKFWSEIYTNEKHIKNNSSIKSLFISYYKLQKIKVHHKQLKKKFHITPLNNLYSIYLTNVY